MQGSAIDGHISATIGLEILVRDVMSTNVISVTKYDSIVSVAKILSEKNISGLPVLDNDGKLIGIITQADILSRLGMKKEHTLKDIIKHMLGEPLPERKTGDIVGEIMVAQPMTIKPSSTIAEAAQILDERKIRRLPVVDENNMLLGIITRADILKAVIRTIH